MKNKLIVFLNRELVKKWYKIILCVLFSLYIFSIPALSDIKPFNYFVYILFFIFSSLTIFYSLFYKEFKLTNYRAFAFVPFLLVATVGTVIYSHAFRLLLTVFLITVSIGVLFIFYQIIHSAKIITFCFVIGFSMFIFLFIIYYRNEILGFFKGDVSRIALDNHFANVNTVGAFLVGLFTFSLYILLFWKSRLTLLNIPVVLLTIMLGIMTGSRMFIITFAFSLVLLIIFRFKNRPLLLAIILIVLIAFTIFIFTIPIFGTIKRRFEDMWNMLSGEAYSSDFSTATRFLWQNYGFYLGSKHFFFGLGVDGFAVYSGTGTYSHANFFELICDVGVFGFLSYYLVWALCFKNAMHIATKEKWLIITLLVVAFVKGFFTVDYYSKFNAFIISYAIFVAYHYGEKTIVGKANAFYSISI